MNAVLSSEHAKQITRGREPLVPVEFEAACKALAACREIDEAKYWSDKASALAAWAKIYHSTKVTREARLLKLHAYRRMAELAADIKGRGRKGRVRDILVEEGLSKTEARQAEGVGRASKEDFERAVASERPPAPWAFTRGADVAELKPLRSMHTLVSHVEPHRIAVLIDAKARETFVRMIGEIVDWCDELEQRLSKANGEET